MSTYAWIIDKDHLVEPGEDPADSDKGTTGPSDAPKALLDRLLAGEGHAFRMLDGDDDLYYAGRTLAVNPDGTDEPDVPGNYSEDFLGPLRDFGMPNAGCVEIQYRDGGTWKGL